MTKKSDVIEEITLLGLTTNHNKFKKICDYHIALYFDLQYQRRLYRDELIDSLQSQLGISIELENWVRIIDLKYSTSPVSPIGSTQFIGGRFNVGKDVSIEIAHNHALYIAINEETAFAEKYPASKKSKLTAAELSLLTNEDSYCYVKLSGKVNNLWDISDEHKSASFLEILAKFEISSKTNKLAKAAGISGWGQISTNEELIHMCLERNWRDYPSLIDIPASSQLFGNLIREAGFTGILYPSTLNGKSCIALFSENFDDDSFVEAKSAPPETRYKKLDNSNWEDQLK